MGQLEGATSLEVGNALLRLPRSATGAPPWVVVVIAVIVIIVDAPLGLNGGTIREPGQIREEAALSVSPRVFYARRGIVVWNHTARSERSA